MAKENDPDELVDLDIEPEQAIKAILDDDAEGDGTDSKERESKS